ncbi:PEPxxWA-CTERM sorting domain-containing protein [Polymorphobacter megasporae]|uniref:PEPxxWA-CTERM sorting domain-containing protein n=1 Tax=Glacieibacterium megasporae TaxID=2835787 RepID=UPI0021084692|nr:PEPxxWA-CTERM sorting domain-containing protein [Polymorphobacter megasporae]
MILRLLVAFGTALSITVALAVPVAARIVQLTVTGNITAGDDSGTDFLGAQVINNVYVESFGPGNFFGTSGALGGKSVVFRLLYDTNSPVLPVPTGGVFDDPNGDWAYALSPVVAVGGIPHDFIDIVPGTFINAATAMLGVIDGAPDGLTGSFTNLTYSGNVYSDYRSSSFAFTAALPPGFFSTDTILPGALPTPHHGFTHGTAIGTGSFAFYRQTCFLTCSLKTATASFDVTNISFAAVPEPAVWAMLLAGFGLVGAMARRNRGAAIVAA